MLENRWLIMLKRLQFLRLLKSIKFYAVRVHIKEALNKRVKFRVESRCWKNGENIGANIYAVPCITLQNLVCADLIELLELQFLHLKSICLSRHAYP